MASNVVTPLAVDDHTAAAMLGISARTLWDLRHSGEIPHLKLGKLVRFSVRDLSDYVQRKAQEATRDRESKRLDDVADLFTDDLAAIARGL